MQKAIDNLKVIDASKEKALFIQQKAFAKDYTVQQVSTRLDGEEEIAYTDSEAQSQYQSYLPTAAVVKDIRRDFTHYNQQNKEGPMAEDDMQKSY